jgi:hypothetical protein
MNEGSPVEVSSKQVGLRFQLLESPISKQYTNSGAPTYFADEEGERGTLFLL